MPRKGIEVMIDKQEIFKSFIFRHLMHTPKKHGLLLEFFLPFPIERWNIKNFVPLPIANLEHLFHLKDVNCECRMNNRHGYHSTQGNNHMGFILRHHFVLVKDFKAIELGMVLNGLNSPIERQGVCIWHHLGSLQKNFRM